MQKLLVIILSSLAMGTMFFLFPNGPTAVLVGGLVTAPVILVLTRQSEEREFLLKIFYAALILRIACALFINTLELQQFFGPDSLTYDIYGKAISDYWLGNIAGNDPLYLKASNQSISGWGMPYIVGVVYLIAGENPLAMQFFCAVLGAATAPAIYVAAREIFSNKRVATVSALITAFSPSMILWSSQALKDGMIVFFLVLSIMAVLKLQKRFSYEYVLLLMVSLIGILSLRFYIFYMLAVAIVGCFIIGQSSTVASTVKRIAILLVIGIGVTSLGIGRGTSEDLSQFNLKKVQNTREDLARGSAGFGKDLDVSTTEGALTALPIGFTYLMLAPFPWQLGNLRQAITMPEMIAWWSAIPFLIMGLVYTIRNRLQASIGVLMFTLMLTVAYSLYQGNVGTAYRQRAQIQIFHFMFIAVGYTLWREKKENKNMMDKLKRHNRRK